MLLKLKLRVYEGLNHIHITNEKQKCKLQFLKEKKRKEDPGILMRNIFWKLLP